MNDNYTIQNARIFLRKDATSNWESNLGQVLGNGEVAFLEPVAGDTIGRMVLGDGKNTLRTLINSEAALNGGDLSQMEFASLLDPLSRSSRHAVFYSGIGAGYTLPAASKDLLGGIKIDNSMFKMEGGILKLSQFEIRYEEGKGSVIHIPYSNLEVDNTLYTHTIKTTDHYKDLGIFVDLNKKITGEVTTLADQTWKFYEQLNNRDLTNIEMNDIPFTIKVPVDENNFEDIKYNSIFIANESIFFIGEDSSVFIAYSEGVWQAEYLRRIIFDNNATIKNYKNIDYINRLLKLGYPAKDEETPNPLPLNSADRLFGGIILNNYKYDDSENKIGPHHGFIGLNYDGTPLYSKDFNIDFPQYTYDTHYLLHSKTDILYGDFKNRILKIDENGTEVTPTFFVTELNSRIKSDGKIELGIELPKENGSNQGSITFKHGKITKFTPKTTSELPEKLISAIVYDEYGHITNYTTDAYCINRIKDTYTKKETDDKITTVSNNANNLTKEVNQLKEAIGQPDQSWNPAKSIWQIIGAKEVGLVVDKTVMQYIVDHDQSIDTLNKQYTTLQTSYNTLSSQYDNLLERVETLESKVNGQE